MGINYDSLIGHFRRDAEAAGRELKEQFKSKGVRPRDFDLGRLFEACFGWHEFRSVRDKKCMAHDVMGRALREATGAVSTASFQNISGQIVYSAVLEAYEAEEMAFTKLIPEEQITNGTLDGEKVAGITEIGDELAVRNEADAYALAGVGEDWIFAPPVKDRGIIVPVTWEAIFADRTGRLLERCGDVGKWCGVNREKRAIDCVIDENTTAHRYNWRGVTIATYGDNSGSHTWDNLAASNALVDWTDLDVAEQVFNGITDPYTGEPVMIEPKHLIVTKQLEQTAMRILNATEIRVATPGYATTGNPTETIVGNPYRSKYQLVSSRLLAARLATDTTWFLGDITKAFRYRVAEQMNVQQLGANSDDEFKRRIVQQFRVNERGAYYTVNPRHMVQNTA